MVSQDSWLYRSGDIWLPQPLVKVLDTYILGNDKSLFYLNYWHINHFLSGILFGLIHLLVYRFSNPVWSYFLLHTLWELWQLYLTMTPRTWRGLIDIVVDTTVGLLGLYVVLYLKGKQ
jgi:hypothetical protein